MYRKYTYVIMSGLKVYNTKHYRKLHSSDIQRCLLTQLNFKHSNNNHDTNSLTPYIVERIAFKFSISLFTIINCCHKNTYLFSSDLFTS